MSVGPLITAVLSEAWQKFGPPTPENQAEVTRWVRERVRAIRARQADGPQPYEPPAFTRTRTGEE